MPGLIRRRLAQAIPVLLLILCGNFLLLHAAPGDVVDTLMIQAGGGDLATQAALRAEYGLDRPLPVQLAIFIAKAVQFDLGRSFFHNERVAVLIAERLPSTMLLMVASVAFAAALGGTLGVIAAWARGLTDRAIMTAGLLITALPSFWVGLLLIVVFAVHLGWAPVGGFETPGAGLTAIARALDILRHLVLPTVALSLFYVAVYLRLMRASMIEVYDRDFVRTARAKGASEARVAWRHVARHALLPVVTMIGVQFGTLMGGSVVVESVFALPGIGRLAYESVIQRDLPTLLGIIYVSALSVIAANLAIDLIYARIDPRIRAA